MTKLESRPFKGEKWKYVFSPTLNVTLPTNGMKKCWRISGSNATHCESSAPTPRRRKDNDQRTGPNQRPGVKSLSHRTLIAAALANGVSEISGALDSDDITRTRGCLTACGAKIEEKGDLLVVTGMKNGPAGGNADGKHPKETPAELFMHESGTTCRIMTAVAAAGKGTFNVHGAPRMHERPMAELVKALESLGVAFEFGEKEGFLPFIMKSKGFRKDKVNITLEESSQYLPACSSAHPWPTTRPSFPSPGKRPSHGLTWR